MRFIMSLLRVKRGMGMKFINLLRMWINCKYIKRLSMKMFGITTNAMQISLLQ
jgi:hypothetical protein